MTEAKQGAATGYQDGDTAKSKCKSCKQETTMRYRVKKSLLGFKKSGHWVCTRCGNSQDELTS